MSRAAFALTVAVVAVIVGWTCWTVTEAPQLEPDDFRYVDLAMQIDRGTAGWTESSVVENRWDRLWFVATDAVVRFFRPAMVASFWMNGSDAEHARGFLVTNIVLHLLCCVLVAAILFRVLADRLAAAAGSVLFAAFCCHAETIWYVSGRNATLAAGAVLAGVLLHVLGGRWRRGGVVAFGCALLAKESTAVLPLVLLCYDRWCGGAGGWRAALARSRSLWVAYAGVLGVYLLARLLVLGGGGDFVFPYFVQPFSADFPLHVLAQVRSYGGNLLAAEYTQPFATWSQVLASATWLGWVTVLAAPLAALLLLRRDARFRWLACAAVLAWLPASFVYVSERYVYLPSFAVAGIAGVAVAAAASRPRLRWAVLALVVVWAGHQGHRLRDLNWRHSHYVRQTLGTTALAAALDGAPEGAKVLVVNLPSEVIHAQFLGSELRVRRRDPHLTARVLTLQPPRADLPQSPAVERIGPRSLKISAPGNLMAAPTLFPWRDFASGTVVSRPGLGFRATILDGDGARCRALRIDLDEPVASYVILRFVRGPAEFDDFPGGRAMLEGRFERIRF